MIGWLCLLVSVLFFGIANFRRKPFLEHAYPYEAQFWEGFGLVPAALLVLLTTPFAMGPGLLMLSAASAFFVTLAVLALYRALEDGQVSVVTAIANLNTHASAFLAFIVFSELFTPRIIAGILLAALVVVMLSKSGTARPGKWLLFSLISLAFFAVKNIVDKAISVSYNPLVGFAFVSLFGAAFYTIPFIFAKHRASNRTKLKLISNGALISIGFATLFIAFSLMPLSIAAPVASMNLLVTALLGAYFLREKLDTRAWLAIALALASVWLLAG